MADCDSCTLCCRLLAIPEIDKPSGKWCPDCKPGKGCQIYDSRPEPCRGWSCLWLLTQQSDKPDDMPEMPPELRPDRCKVIFDTGHEGAENALFVHVDPGRPDAWKEPPVMRLIDRWLTDDKARVVIITGNRRRMFAKKQMNQMRGLQTQ